MSAWVGVVISAAIAMLSAGVAVGLIKGMLVQLTEGQCRLQEAVTEMTHAVSALTAASAVNVSQHDDLSRRISLIEAYVGECAESIRVLRVRSHLVANKLMEIDPAWRYYSLAENK